MTVYTYDHMHLRSRDPIATARYFETMFDAQVLESVQEHLLLPVVRVLGIEHALTG